MSGQRGAGNVAIPTLAFSSLEGFATEAATRGLGTNDLNAIRVQPHEIPKAGGVFCYTVSVTAFDDQRGCILALQCRVGCHIDGYGPEGSGSNGPWPETAHIGLMDRLYRVHGFIVGLGEWMHDPIPADLWTQWERE